ncbi:hypothetical protein [Dongia sedimenti]|uniref:Uncharacterized protein n=1 Tax=Dongia sedimenti TaxID=3064282 RepID=A0ABU0YSD1_9PROT|nr:hypothetical protein [Rhodospirillaceae bacterium R-7]
MHATRARLPQKRTAKKTVAKKSTGKKATPKLAAPAELPLGVASLAAHRALLPQRVPLGAEIYVLVEWIAPARESWRRGELEVRRTACMPMTATTQADGGLMLTDLPGQGDAVLLGRAMLEALVSRAVPSLQLALPGMRVTVTAEDLLPALPAPRKPAQVLAFPRA